MLQEVVRLDAAKVDYPQGQGALKVLALVIVGQVVRPTVCAQMD